MYAVSRFLLEDFSDRSIGDFERLLKELSGKEFVFTSSELAAVFSDSNLLHFVVRSDEDTIVGYCCVVKMNLLQGTRYHIESVIVDQKWRRNGIGTSLIEYVLAYLREAGAPHVTLTCNPKRIEAVRLYKKIGFSRPETDVYRCYF